MDEGVPPGAPLSALPLQQIPTLFFGWKAPPVEIKKAIDLFKNISQMPYLQ